MHRARALITVSRRFFSPTSGMLFAVRLRRSSAISRCLTFAVVLCLAIPCGFAQSPGEYMVKAAFIFHFAQMVEWPTDAIAAGAAPIVMCVADDDSYASALHSAVDGKLIGTHPIEIRYLREKASPRGCHLLVITGEDKKRRQAVLDAVKDAPILTVGDSEDFTATGGVIGLFLEDNKIRFDINLNAAQRANLKISSRLLLLARNVIAAGKQG